MDPIDASRLDAAARSLAALGFSTTIDGARVVASKGGLKLSVDWSDAVLGERLDAVHLAMPRPGAEPFRFGVHADGTKLDAILAILAETADALERGDPAPFAARAKQAGLTWFADPE